MEIKKNYPSFFLLPSFKENLSHPKWFGFFMSKQSRFGFKNEAPKMDFWDLGQNKDISYQYILRDARLLFHYKFCCLLHDNAFEAHFH